jgi:hypothetical protein
MMQLPTRLRLWPLALCACVAACGEGADDSAGPGTPPKDDAAADMALDKTPVTESPPANTQTQPSAPEPSRVPSEDTEQTRVELRESDTGTEAPPPTLPANACEAIVSELSCERCVCERCQDSFQKCVDTPGCPEILQCALEAGCTGTDCFCGDASVTNCLNGQGNGPCKNVFLAAPDGREPTLTRPSGGPAADAANAIASCAERADDCSSLCFDD